MSEVNGTSMTPTIPINEIVMTEWRYSQLNVGNGTVMVLSFNDPRHGWRHYAMAPEAVVILRNALIVAPTSIPDTTEEHI